MNVLLEVRITVHNFMRRLIHVCQNIWFRLDECVIGDKGLENVL